MNIFDIVNVPLAYILRLCYMLVNNYGIAILMFAFISKLLLLPLAVKGEKNKLVMAKFQPKMNALQAKYKGNTKDPKYNEDLQKLYQAEGYNPMSGCLPMLIQLPLMLGLYNAIRNPLTYINDIPKSVVTKIIELLNALPQYAEPNHLMESNQIFVAKAISENQSVVQHLLPQAFENIKMTFFGLNMGEKPIFGLDPTVLIPILSGITSLIITIVSQQVNKKTAVQSPDAKKSNPNALLYTMPLISVWIGYGFPLGIGIYWIFSNILTLIQTILLAVFIKAPKEAVIIKEKKINYNQIEKLKAAEELAAFNEEIKKDGIDDGDNNNG